MERRKLVPMNWEQLQAAALAERQDPKWERKWHAPPSPKRAGWGNDRANRVSGADAPIQVSPRKNKGQNGKTKTCADELGTTAGCCFG